MTDARPSPAVPTRALVKSPLPPPAWLLHARAELGVHETPGPVSTARILAYRDTADLHLAGDDGVVPWCAIFVGAMLVKAGLTNSRSAMARSYVRWGVPCAAIPGAVATFSSSRGPSSGHVAFATGRVTATHIEVLGGNQGDAVSIAMMPLARLLATRWPATVPVPAGGPVTIAAGAPAHPVSDA